MTVESLLFSRITQAAPVEARGGGLFATFLYVGHRS